MQKFKSPLSPERQETTQEFRPKFDDRGLVAAICCDAATGDVLMLAHMNEQALAKTLETGEAHYWSRSREQIWHKGATSGNVQKIVEMRTDCDQDAVLLMVEMTGHKAACHTGRTSCFYRRVESADGGTRLVDDGTEPEFDPKEVYGK